MISNNNRQTSSKVRLGTTIVTFSALSLILSPSLAMAATSGNSQFMINVDTIDTDPQPTPKTAIPSPQFTPVPTLPEFTTGLNYTVNQNDRAFSFSISQNSIDFGILSANTPVIRTSEITMTHPLYGAQVLTFEDKPLTKEDNVIIPDTTCDNGTCSPEVAAEWSSTFTYGFGYRCESKAKDVCDKMFIRSKDFKQYPDISRDKPFSTLITSLKNTNTTQSTIYYKLNVPKSQQPGIYQNTITFVAVPNF